MLTCIQTVYNGVASFKQTEEKPDISAETIANIVAVGLDISLADMRSNTRKRPVVEARHIAMYLIRKHTEISLKQTGSLFGGRDHSTVIHACHTVNNLVQTNKLFKQVISKLNRKIYEN